MCRCKVVVAQSSPLPYLDEAFRVRVFLLAASSFYAEDVGFRQNHQPELLPAFRLWTFPSFFIRLLISSASGRCCLAARQAGDVQ